MSAVKIGDRIRFLNASGGGIVRRIEKKIAWVEGDDGFELPTPLSECVVINSDDTFAPAYKTPAEKREQEELAQREKQKSKAQHITAAGATAHLPQKDLQPQPSPIIDRPGGDLINLHLAYLPVEYEHFGSVPYELYVVNESNYTLSLIYSARSKNGRYHLRYQGSVEPDTRTFIEEFSANEINEIEYGIFQFIPYKTHKGYEVLQPYSIEVRLDGVKLFKRHCFKENPFFDEDAIIHTLIEKGKSITGSNASKEIEPPAEKRKDRSGSLEFKKMQDTAVPQKSSISKPNKQSQVEVVDLHASALLEDCSGMTPHEILLFQIKTLEKEINKRIGNKGDRIIFIHGKGQGVLRDSIIRTIERKYKTLSYRDASFQEYGFGALEVSIH